MVTQELMLPLDEISDCLIHHGFRIDTWLAGNDHPEMLAEEVLNHPPFWGVAVVPLVRVTAENVPECCID